MVTGNKKWLILLSALPLLIALGLGSELTRAQNSPAEQKTDGIEITQAEWFVGRDWDAFNRAEFGTRNSLNYGYSRVDYQRTIAQKFAALPKEGFIYQIKLHNNYSKEITSITWEYVFQNPLNGEVLETHSFVNRKRIKPNQSQTIFEFSEQPPTKFITVKMLEKNQKKPYLERARVKSVMFSDGTTFDFP